MENAEWTVEDLNSKVLSLRSISNLYDWQIDALSWFSNIRNGVFTAPTNGGKTLVAELRMLSELLIKVPVHLS